VGPGAVPFQESPQFTKIGLPIVATGNEGYPCQERFIAPEEPGGIIQNDPVVETGQLKVLPGIHGLQVKLEEIDEIHQFFQELPVAEKAALQGGVNVFFPAKLKESLHEPGLEKRFTTGKGQAPSRPSPKRAVGFYFSE